MTEGCSEKIAKKLIGRTEIEDALKRLDKLTQDEVRMATAQNLKVTHTVDKGVKEVMDTVVAMDDRVASVDNKVTEVIAGTQNILNSVLNMIFTLKSFRWKDGKVIYAKNCQRHRSSTTFVVSFTVIDLQTHAPSQGTNYDRTFVDGSLHRILPQTITLRAVLIMRGLRRGFFEEMFSTSGGPLAPYFGFMANVCPSTTFI